MKKSKSEHLKFANNDHLLESREKCRSNKRSMRGERKHEKGKEEKRKKIERRHNGDNHRQNSREER